MLKVGGLSVEKALLKITDVTFEVNKGEILSIIGSNGSGKSIIIERIANPESDYTGTVTVNHYKSRTEAEKYKSQIGYLPQAFHPPLHLTGYEFLEIIGSLYNLEGEARSKKIINLAKTFLC